MRFLQIIGLVVSVTGGALALANIYIKQTLPWLRARRGSRLFLERVGADIYTPAEIKRAIRYYVSPMCQTVDPAGGDEPSSSHGVGIKELFGFLDEAFGDSTKLRYLILLADSGIGKTSALINYYARNSRFWFTLRFRPKFKLAIINLGLKDTDERIAAVEDKPNTILLLDALDEDTDAVVDLGDRIQTLVDATRNFQRVLITCRTQFFAKDQEIPERTGLIKIGPRPAGEPAEYSFQKVYLSPFTKREVSSYLKRRYPFWRWQDRKLALRMSEKIKHLSARPMLLAHIDELINAEREITHSFELYEEMVGAWLKREEGFIHNAEDLRQFSGHLAVDLYVNRERRGAERISRREIKRLADEWGIPLDEWKLTSHSLLNRDAEGNYKFAHRSVMEYLFVKRFLGGDPRCWDAEWTDQMKTFFWEMLEKSVISNERSSSQSMTADHDPVEELRLLMPVKDNIPLIIKMVAHGISLLGTNALHHPRLDSIGITLAALCGVILNPEASGAMRVTLWYIRNKSDTPMPFGTYGQGGVENHIAMYFFNKPDNIREAFAAPTEERVFYRTIEGRRVVCLPVTRRADLRYMLTVEADQNITLSGTHIRTLYQTFQLMPDFL